MASFGRFYTKNLVKHPLITNGLTSSASMALGNLLAQKIEGKKPIDQGQISRFALSGLICIGPGCRLGYVIIEKFIGPTSSPTKLIKKVLIDQCCGAVLLLSSNIILLNYLESGSIEKAKDECKKSFCDIYKLNIMIWPWFQIFNFSVVPLKFRVVTGSLMALVWNTLLAYTINKNKQS